MRILLFVLFISLLACGGTNRVANFSTTNKKPIVIKVAPAEFLVPFVIEASNRWWNSVGIDIQISNDGIPVRIIPQLFSGDQKLRARSIISKGKVVEIQISSTRLLAGEAAILATITHEFGHMLGFLEHTNFGIMQTSTLIDSKINWEDTFEICMRNRCLWNIPEI